MKYGIVVPVDYKSTKDDFVKAVSIITENIFREIDKANDEPVLSTFKIECETEPNVIAVHASIQANMKDVESAMMSDSFIDALRGK